VQLANAKRVGKLLPGGEFLPENEARTRLISAARELFFKHGYSAVSTDMLAREAQMSKSTLYAVSGTKAEIFSDVILQETKRYTRDMATMPTHGEAYLEAFADYGCAFLDLISDPDIARFERLMLSRATEDKVSAKLFYESAHLAAEINVAAMIQLGQDNGIVASHLSALRLARHLTSAWLGAVHRQLQLDICDEGYGNVRDHVTEVMDLVLSPVLK